MPVAGKLFDETGDRLTQSHSRKKGKRLRYYTSHRLVKDRSQIHPDAWRLPAEQLERQINDLIKRCLTLTNMVTRLVPRASAVEVTQINEKLQSIQSRKTCLGLIERADIQPGKLSLLMDHTQIAKLSDIAPKRMDPDQPLSEVPFQVHRRGVELKLHLGETPNEVDKTLVCNIVKAQRWLAMVVDGKTIADIAMAENTPKSRVHDVVSLALLAPELLDAIAVGELSTRLTSDYLIKSGAPADWEEQRQIFSEL
ncbi:MAG: hypothetical protein AAGF25_08430 [Pseudomonadota bacterium]